MTPYLSQSSKKGKRKKIRGAHKNEKIVGGVYGDLRIHLEVDNIEPYLRSNDRGLLPEVSKMYCHQGGSITTLL